MASGSGPTRSSARSTRPVAYERLLPGLRGPRAVRSGAVLAVRGGLARGCAGCPPADAAHHNIHFATEWDSAFDALIGDLELMPDPSRLVTVPSLTDPSLAAPGGSTLYVLEPVPHSAARSTGSASVARCASG